MDLYKAARAFPASLQGSATVLTSTQLNDAGVSRNSMRWHTHKQRLVRAHRGVYLVARGGPVDLLDHVRAALQVSPPGTVVGFHTAAALLGFGVPEDANVHVVVPQGGPFPQRRGITVHQAKLPVGEPVRPLGIPCTPPARTAIDLASSLDRVTALAVLDAALFAEACTRAQLEHEASRHAGLAGITQARALVVLADGRAECKQESHLRLILHDGGLTGFEPQVRIHDPELPWREKYRLDLADRALRIAAEYDGESHTRDSLRGDRARHNWLDGMGWRMRYFTATDLYRRPHTIVPTIRSAIEESGPRSRGYA